MDPAAGGMREIPYVRSQRFVNDTMRAACSQMSLARLERRLTWLGDVTFKRDDLPWDSAAEMRVPVDEDLQLVCQRLTQHYRKEVLAAAADNKPRSACRALGCGRVPPPHVALLETTLKLAYQPMALLKLAPVFVMAFVLPLLFLPMISPPQDPVHAKDVKAAGGAGEGKQGEGKKTK